MVVPSAMMIEQASDQLKDNDYMHEHDVMLNKQMKEIQAALPNHDISLYAGVMIGIQTARIFLSGNMAAIHAKVDF